METKMFFTRSMIVKIFGLAIIGTIVVATLALDLRPKQGLAKVQAKNEPRSHISCSQECKRV
jgi:Na+-transporting NADH:ubiquinone oxidoreductase subunit NqrC